MWRSFWSPLGGELASDPGIALGRLGDISHDSGDFKLGQVLGMYSGEAVGISQDETLFKNHENGTGTVHFLQSSVAAQSFAASRRIVQQEVPKILLVASLSLGT